MVHSPEPMKRLPSATQVPKTAATAIDLFSGCGGLTLGLKRAGFRVIGAVDNDRLAVETYSANHSEVGVWRRDITRLSPAALRRKLHLRVGQLDLLAGCPPCQAFSRLRTLNGKRTVRDRAKDLLFQFLRFTKALKPKTVMVENVPGLAEDKRIVALCMRLARMGYESEYRVLDAARFSVPQRRRRMILLASRTERLRFASPRHTRRTVRHAIGRLPKSGRSGDDLHDISERRSRAVRDLIRRIPSDGGSRTDLPVRLQLDCHRKCDGFKDVYGRMAWNDVAPTITSGCFNPSKGRFLHPVQDRAITMREAALLQGFPRSYSFSAKDGRVALALMIGNALPPPLIAAQARTIRQALRKVHSSYS